MTHASCFPYLFYVLNLNVKIWLYEQDEPASTPNTLEQYDKVAVQICFPGFAFSINCCGFSHTTYGILSYILIDDFGTPMEI